MGSMVKYQGVACGIIKHICPLFIVDDDDDGDDEGGRGGGDKEEGGGAGGEGEIKNLNNLLMRLIWYLTSSQQDQTVYRQVLSNSHGTNTTLNKVISIFQKQTEHFPTQSIKLEEP